MARESLVEATQEQGHDDLQSPPSRFHRPATVALGLVFLFVPLIAYVLGDRAQEIENHRLASAPHLADGWDVFPNASAWFTDHMPLRREGIHANTWLSNTLFREEPSYGNGTQASSSGVGAAGTGANTGSGATKGASNTPAYPAVVSGRHGWLYLGNDFAFPCQSQGTVDATTARLRRLEQVITGSGRRLVFTIAPNKSTIAPDNLPDHYLGKDCAARRTRELWTAFAQDAPASYFDLRGPLEARQRQDGVPIYPALNSHWLPIGSAIYAHTLADALDPALWGNSRIESAGTTQSQGDLTGLLGEPRSEAEPAWNVVRPGVTGDSQRVGPHLGQQPLPLTNATTDAPLYPARTLLLGDSFTEAALPDLSTLFANVVAVQLRLPTDVIAEQIAAADVVVIEIVERSMAAGNATLLSPASLNAIETTLQQAGPPSSAATTPGK